MTPPDRLPSDTPDPEHRIPDDWTVFSTCPVPDGNADGRGSFRDTVVQVARWSEEVGCTGILVYTDNSLPDPWLLAQLILDSTSHLSPLVAVQPVYVHPYAAAKFISTLGLLHGRRIHLNMVAGGFRNDLLSLGDHTPHDRRYDRVVEYVEVIQRLLSDTPPVSYAGEFYTVERTGFRPSLAPDLHPGILLSGSSEAGLAAARRLGATAIQYPEPPPESGGEQLSDGTYGIRVGIIARGDEEEAWEVAHARFPPDREGQLKHRLAMKVSDSVWHHQLSRQADELRGTRSTYWLHPFENYRTFCPYLVGSYETVASALLRYRSLGYRTVILDIPPTREELQHIGRVFSLAVGDPATRGGGAGVAP